jgi:hypothetical protein
MQVQLFLFSEVRDCAGSRGEGLSYNVNTNRLRNGYLTGRRRKQSIALGILINRHPRQSTDQGCFWQCFRCEFVGDGQTPWVNASLPLDGIGVHDRQSGCISG